MRQVIPGISGFPLGAATKLRCSDPQIAERTVGTLVEPRQLRMQNAAGKADIRISHINIGAGHLFGVSHGAALVATSAPIGSYQVMAPLRGELIGRNRHGEIHATPGLALVYSPGDCLDTCWSEGCISLVLSVPAEHLRALARYGCPGTDVSALRLNPLMSLEKGSGRSFAQTLGLIAQESVDPDSAFRQGLTTRLLEQSLLLSLLAAQLPSDERLSDLPVSAYMRRALAAIEHDDGKDIGITDLAAAAGVSVRTLQYGFQEQFGVGPITYLKQYRMRQVHAALQTACPGSCTIGDIAARWGFHHGSAFARAYRKMFGRLPSETLAGRL